jgi:hypothetical protein
MASFWRRVALGGMLGLSAGANAAEDDGAPLVEKVTIPDGMVEWSSTLTGGFYVPADLKKRHDDLVGRLENLKRELDLGTISGPDATATLAKLRTDLQETRAAAEKARVEIHATKAHRLRRTETIELSSERLLVVTAPAIRVVPTNEPVVKAVIEAIILGGDENDARAQLKDITLEHRTAPQPELVGRSKAEADEEERKFLASPDGLKLTPQARMTRDSFRETIRESWKNFADFQGRPVTSIRVVGMTHQEGNRQLGLSLMSEKTGGSQRYVWRRSAVLTLHVPAKTKVALRGPRRGLIVEGLDGKLLVTGQGESDRDFDARFEIRKVTGDVTVDDFPLHAVEGIGGSVNIQALADFANSGQRFTDRGHTTFRFPPLGCRCRDIKGDLTAAFGRVDLELSDIGGTIDTLNEAGDTELSLRAPLADRPHRVRSLSGAVRLTGPVASLGKLPVFAASGQGSVQSTASQRDFPFFMVTLGGPPARSWSGVQRKLDAPTMWFDSPLDPKNRGRALVLTSLTGIVRFEPDGK